VVRQNSIRHPADSDVGPYFLGLRDLENREARCWQEKIPQPD